jgi:hypothetical protein
VAYEDWAEDFREVFDSVPGADYLSDEQEFIAEALFEIGFTMHSEELERLGYSPDDVQSIRDEFFEIMGIDSASFDWEEWREAMGYE